MTAALPLRHGPVSRFGERPAPLLLRVPSHARRVSRGRRGASRRRRPRSRCRLPAARHARPRVRLGAVAPSPVARGSFLSHHGLSDLSAAARRPADGFRRHASHAAIGPVSACPHPEPALDAATVSSVAVPVRHSPNPAVCGPSSGVADDGPLSSGLPVGRSGRPPGPSDRSPGSIPPGAASPRPAPRSPLTRSSPFRSRSLAPSLAGARCALRLPKTQKKPATARRHCSTELLPTSSRARPGVG